MEQVERELPARHEVPPQDQALPDDEGPRVTGPNDIVYVGQSLAITGGQTIISVYGKKIQNSPEGGICM